MWTWLLRALGLAWDVFRCVLCGRTARCRHPDKPDGWVHTLEGWICTFCRRSAKNAPGAPEAPIA